VWSPDGQQIAYASMRGDNLNFDFELFLMDAESGQHKIKLTHNDTDDACPDWSEDSKSIVFQHEKVQFPYPHEVRERHRGPNPSICSLLLYPDLAIFFN